MLLSITVTFVVADGPLTSINEKCASMLAVVCVLPGLQNKGEVAGVILLFMRHKFLVITVKNPL